MDTYLLEMEKTAERIWKRLTLEEVGSKLLELWNDEYQPILPLDKKEVTCAVVGSGSFSTGREEVLRNYIARRKVNIPVKYVAVITNSKDSGAKNVADEFKLPLIEVDYLDWKKEYGFEGSTKIFGDYSISKTELKKRFEVRREFEKTVLEKVEYVLGMLPDTFSLRGYNSVLTCSKWRCVDNTHPADLRVRNKDGFPRYAGWQESAYKKMAMDGKDIFRASLIKVEPLSGIQSIKKVDAGELIAVSPGKSKEYDKKEDHFVLSLKSYGLLAFFGLSKRLKNVEYFDVDGRAVYVKQREVVVYDRIKSGKSAFGSSEKDLEILKMGWRE